MSVMLMALWLAGCVQDVGKDRVAATVEDVPAKVEQPTAPAGKVLQQKCASSSRRCNPICAPGVGQLTRFA